MRLCMHFFSKGCAARLQLCHLWQRIALFCQDIFGGQCRYRAGLLVLNDSVRIRDHNWRRGGYGMLIYRHVILYMSRIGMYHAMMPPPDDMNYCRYVTDQTKSTNAMEQDTVLNNIFHVDSVNVAVERRINIREIAIGMFKEEGIQHKHAPKYVELVGVYNVADVGN